jgi:DNA-binding NtrC family response regulator
MRTTFEMPEPIAKSETVKPAKRRILLVDDDPSIRQILSKLLSEEDYLVLTASNGVEAQELIKVAKFDLVLLDLCMPAENGWETFAKLLTNNPLLPVILITAYPSQLFSALAAGTGALLEKPLDFTKLSDTIRNVLQEPQEVRLARVSGQPTQFRFTPPKVSVSQKVWRAH